MLHLIIATTLGMGLPTWNALDCDRLSELPLGDLAEACLVCQRRHSTLRDTVARCDVRAAVPGSEVTFTFEDSGYIHVCHAVTRDTAGNWSCPSNLVAVNLPPLEVVRAPAPDRVEYFDVAGRRLPGPPTIPGVYFERGPQGRRPRVWPPGLTVIRRPQGASP